MLQEQEVGRRWQLESDGGRLQHTVLELGPDTDPGTATPGPSRPPDTEPDHWEVSFFFFCFTSRRSRRGDLGRGRVHGRVDAAHPP